MENDNSDGTFTSRPTLFQQHYLIHAKVEQFYIPAVFVLMSGKTEEMYRKMLAILKDACGLNQWQPRVIMLDFEKASMNAFHKEFADVRVKGCFFHFAQCFFNNWVSEMKMV
jgi:hypothetical protein